LRSRDRDATDQPQQVFWRWGERRQERQRDCVSGAIGVWLREVHGGGDLRLREINLWLAQFHLEET
jgi:hypothetical protein